MRKVGCTSRSSSHDAHSTLKRALGGTAQVGGRCSHVGRSSSHVEGWYRQISGDFQEDSSVVGRVMVFGGGVGIALNRGLMRGTPAKSGRPGVTCTCGRSTAEYQF